ncbi:MAG: class I adenylate-forming enzyme family protein [Acidimicrobiales bacterium]
MNVAMLLEMAADGFGDRVAFGPRAGGMTYADLLARARRAAGWLVERPVDHLGMVDLNSEAVPVALFAAAVAGKPFVPMNYRLADAQLQGIVARTAPAAVVIDPPVADRLSPIDGVELVTRADFLAASADPGREAYEGWTDPDEIAVLLFTSGTTGEPKAAVLRHKHLASYIVTTLDYMGADEEECALVSVPPYHIAGVSAVLSSVYTGRRVVQLSQFTPEAWVGLARDEAVTHAMVVPTMLGRILDVLEAEGESLPALRHLAYGGGRMPVPVVERALTLLPHVSFVNAYGLTETSSTIAVLGPDDHRAAMASDDLAVRARLGSVGRPLPTLELEIRDPLGQALPAGERGEVCVRGEQVSGEYLGRKLTDDEGWFATKDAGFLDAEGYLFIDGRLDDVIVRGGENMSPGEIEEVLLAHPAVDQAAVVGVPDTEWGEKVAAAIVLKPGTAASVEELQQWVKDRLRSSRMPELVEFREELPFNETGKLLRRVLRTELGG